MEPLRPDEPPATAPGAPEPAPRRQVTTRQYLWIVGAAAVAFLGLHFLGPVLTPFLVGDRIGLHPVAVIFAVLAGGQLFGFVGVLVALPVAAVVMVLLRYLYQEYTASRLYAGEHPPPDGPSPPAGEPPPIRRKANPRGRRRRGRRAETDPGTDPGGSGA